MCEITEENYRDVCVSAIEDLWRIHSIEHLCETYTKDETFAWTDVIEWWLREGSKDGVEIKFCVRRIAEIIHYLHKRY
jgi:hypothetical protein